MIRVKADRTHRAVVTRGPLLMKPMYITSKFNYENIQDTCGPGSSVGIATELRAGWSGIESRWGRDFPPVQTGPGAHPASCKMGTGSFPGVKCGWGVLLTTHPLLVPRSRKSRELYLYPPSRPHRPVIGITLLYLYFKLVHNIQYRFQ